MMSYNAKQGKATDALDKIKEAQAALDDCETMSLATLTEIGERARKNHETIDADITRAYNHLIDAVNILKNYEQI